MKDLIFVPLKCVNILLNLMLEEHVKRLNEIVAPVAVWLVSNNASIEEV